MEALLVSTGSYAASVRFTLADIPIGLSINRWFMTSICERPHYPEVQAYYERLNERPAFVRHGRNGIP